MSYTRDLHWLTSDTDIQRIENDDDGSPIYIGKAAAGTLESMARWQIRKLSYTGGFFTALNFADSSPSYRFVWDDRAGYSYGASSVIYSGIYLTSPDGTQWAFTILPAGNIYTEVALIAASDGLVSASFVLLDSTSASWTIGISNNGNLITLPGGSSALSGLTLRDSGGDTWNLTILSDGNLVTTETV